MHKSNERHIEPTLELKKKNNLWTLPSPTNLNGYAYQDVVHAPLSNVFRNPPLPHPLFPLLGDEYMYRNEVEG